MEGKLNRLYFTVNLREGDLECLISSLNRLRQVEILAVKQGIETERELEDYERIVTLLVPTAGLTPLASELKNMSIEPGTLDVYDPAALSLVKDLGFVIEDMTSEDQSYKCG
jgi:hypothetical protein